MRVTFVNQHGSNRGDHAAYLTQIDILSTKIQEPLEIVVIYNVTRLPFPDPIGAANSFVHVPDEAHNWWTKIVFMLIVLFPDFSFLHHLSSYTRKVRRHMLQSDHIFLSNGGANIGPYRDWKYLARLCIAHSTKKPVESFGNSIGPSGSRLFDRKALKVLSKFKKLRLRDKTSQEYAAKHEIRYTETLDIVFHDSKVLQLDTYIPTAEPYVVFVPNELYGWHPHFKDRKDLFQLYLGIMEHLDKMGYRIVCLPQLFGDNHIKDFDFFKELNAKFSGRDLLISDESTSPSQQISAISNATLVVGGRYHSIVFAISSGRPFVSLSYESKMEGMLRFLELSRYNIGIGTAKLPEVIELIEQVVANSSEIAKEIQRSRSQAANVIKGAFSDS